MRGLYVFGVTRSRIQPLGHYVNHDVTQTVGVSNLKCL